MLRTMIAMMLVAGWGLLVAAGCGSGGSGGNGGGGSGGSGGSGGIPCVDTAPEEEIDILNACTGVGCQPFNNAVRLPRLGPNGELPELP